jgi:RNA polymerase sigma-70 factor (ECF subfamily)
VDGVGCLGVCGRCQACDARIEELWVHRVHLVALYVQRGLERHSAEDLVAEVYATVWRRLEDLPTSVECATEWLFGVARHLYLNHRRGERRQAALAERLASGRCELSSKHPEESRLVAAHIWRSLPPTDRDVLHLVIDEGAALDRLARSLGCSYSAAAMRLSRIRRRVVRDLG